MCLKYFGIVILEPRWICWLRLIVFFLSFVILCFGTSFKLLEIAQLLEYSQSDILRSIFDNVVKFDNIKRLTIYAQEEKQFYFLHHLWHFMCNVELTWPKIIVYLIEHVVLFLHPSSFPMHSPSRHKTSSRQLRIVLELSCLDKTFLRHLQDVFM